MQLDRTRILIRERGLLETLDLALQILRQHAGPLLATFALGCVPLILINHALLGWLMEADFREGWYLEDESSIVARFAWDMTALVVIEAPLASIFTTAYLGKIVFLDRPNIGEVFRDVLALLPRVAWTQLLLRGTAVAWLLCLTLDRYGEFDVFTEFFLLGGLAGYSMLVRALRPYLNEIVLLERNPLRAAAPEAITIGKRNKQLHAPSSGDLLARWLGAAMFAVLLTISVMGTFVFLYGVFLNDWKIQPFLFVWVYPLSMWLVAGYMSVVRFLNYLDLRIRHEGWEVELRMRAEAARLLHTT